MTAAACSPEGGPSSGGPSLADRLQPSGEQLDLESIPSLRVSRAADGRAYDMVLATGNTVLVEDDPARTPERRALDFLANHGAVVGMTAADRAAVPATPRRVVRGALGATHVRLAQTHDGLPVVGAELVVHLNERGVTGVNGDWIPAPSLDTSPDLAGERAEEIAVGALGKGTGGVHATGRELAVFSPGLLRGTGRDAVLAWGIDVAGDEGRHRVWIGAHDGRVLERYPLDHDALDRIVYTPQYDPDNPDMFVARREGDPPTLAQPVDDLYDFSGHTYDLFASAFGRDSYDGNGATMRTVYLVNQVCPNAYWDGTTTNYCPGFVLDDVVAHEWGHAYTQHTHGLIYSYQSGALNESYSDIWGEVVDLHNGVDGAAGGSNDQPAPDGNRWQVGEDFGTGSGEYELLLRDMYDPERLGYPGHVTSDNYACGSGDGGGVHTNSGVPNHAFAMLVDGKTYNGVTVNGIGMTKAAHIYYRAMVAYQTPASNFQAHADALAASCADLVGQPLAAPVGVPEAGPITEADCAEVENAMRATEMRTPPSHCGFEPLLEPGTAPACPAGAPVFAEDWSDGLGSWTTTSNGVNPEWPGYAWEVVSNKPAGEPGNAAFAVDSVAGTCAPGGDYSGTFTLDSPTLEYPARADGRADGLELRFEHYVETELNYDGGNVAISVNGGPYELLPAAAYRFNGPESNLAEAPPVGQNTNPKAGERAWHGANEGSSLGSWGTTIVDLTAVVAPGDTFQIRFDFGIDGCNGVTGWYVGDVTVASCPPGPTVDAAAGDPDGDGTFGLSWDRPPGAFGPDEVEQSIGTCGPALAEDAESGTGGWEVASGVGTTPWDTGPAKPNHDSSVLYTEGVEGGGGSATLTTPSAIAIPAGGTATLRFLEWYVNEPDDRGFVEVSVDGGASWEQVYTVDRAMLAGEADAAFTTEAMQARTLDLGAYAGESILLRFRYQLGESNYFFYKPTGWYLDDIELQTDAWIRIAEVDGTSTAVSGRADGTYCYRARTFYDTGDSTAAGPYSNRVEVTVRRTDGAGDRDGDGVADPDDNCPDEPNPAQTDADGDGVGDACDSTAPDGDGDGVPDVDDNCPDTANADQADADGDGTGDACDATPRGPDSDGDGVPDAEDNCPARKNKKQKDRDGDGIGDKCDDWRGRSGRD